MEDITATLKTIQEEQRHAQEERNEISHLVTTTHEVTTEKLLNIDRQAALG